MRRGFGPLALTLFLFFFALLTLPGDGNQGSVAGSCYCDRTIPSGTQIPPATLNHMRKYLKTFHRCQFFIRFQLQSKSVCGGSQDQWVRELVNCFEHKQCGIGHGQSFHHQKHVPQASYGLEARPVAEANEKQHKQQKEPGAGAGTQALVPVLSLLAIVFFLVAAMVCVLCNRRVTRQSSSGLQLCYTPVEPRPQGL
ncbi:similar to chemokine (C-X-C motif) ligand 16, isoform CRA_a [Rattus norvegicus]|uniref:C-X-C motif chemokine 16 n=1 Tax=Rattus norvegicus TaxID=10116 RepID=A6HG51_RAT|nr:similar to chemokine (C-X-C motif) ligand 16, isoform CRA_a [Rattus norvegicus]EDM05008.1 similar to chemokine (C-X-C motif) ligand 16, isoform CRA_a [Rattus norvegicus]